MTEINEEFVGHAVAKVKIRRRPLMFVAPTPRQFSYDVRNFASMFNDTNLKLDNVMLHKDIGAITVSPLLVNRSNYIVESNKPNKKYTVQVPRGAKPESNNEIKKRVFRSYPNEFQIAAAESPELFKRGGFVYPGNVPPEGDKDESPRFRDQDMKPIFSSDDNSNVATASWILQAKASGNAEWFIMQEYGNFANEPFWIDLFKFKKQEPYGEKGTLEADRYAVYGKEKELHAYFGFRIGWEDSEDIKNINGKGLMRVRNSGQAKIGPYDVIFPIDGTPFIFDHQGEGIDGVRNQNTSPFRYQRGLVVSEAPDNSWTITDDMENVRLFFWVLRGKLVITASHTSTSWIFPSNISPQVSEDTKSRYQNFCIPPGKVCFFGRGFAWRMSYNPTEFNVFSGGEDIESTKGYHGKVRFLPVLERSSFPNDVKGGWRGVVSSEDTREAEESGENTSGREGVHNFTLIPDDNFRSPNGGPTGSVLSYSYGWDVVTKPYYGLSRSAAGNVTSMMIPIQGEPFQPKVEGAYTPRSIVNAYLDSPSGEDAYAGIESTGSGFGFDTTVLDATNLQYHTKYPTVELSCRWPSYEFGENSYTKNISHRFASPVFWAINGVHVVPSPSLPEWEDITPLVKDVSYEISCNDFISYNQNFNVNIIVPKDYQLKDFGLGSENFNSYTDSQQRDEFIKKIYSGVLEIEVSLGWLAGSSVDPALYEQNIGPVRMQGISVNGHQGRVAKIFTGLAYAGQMTQTFDLDTIALNCKDFLNVLQDQIIINSPIFDGMATDKAFYEIGQLGGLPRRMFDARSSTANWHILPMGFTFQEPKLKFPKNSTILAAVKQVAQYFMHIIRSDPDGKIVLGDVYYDQDSSGEEKYLGATKKISELKTTHSSYDFYVDGAKGWQGQGGPPNPWQRCYETFTFDKTIQDQATQLLIMTVDRNDGAFIMDNRALDLAAIEDPSANNFIGYSKMMRYQNPALGDNQHLELLKKNFANRVFTAPMKIGFTTYGRPTIRALDIIGVYHTHDLNISGPDVAIKGRNYLKYRVISVKGSVTWEDAKFQFKTEITAEHL